MTALQRLAASLTLLLTIVASSAAGAQARTVLSVTRIDTDTYPQTKVYIAAPVGELPDPSLLRLSEDGRPVDPALITAQARRVGVAVTVLVDASRSMRGRGAAGSSDRMQDAREQTIALARALNFDTDVISVQAFHRDIVEVVPISRVDGGAVENLVLTSEVLGPVPDKPGGPARVPNDEDLRADPRAFSAVSQAVGKAIDEFLNPSTNDAYIRENLPAMQKVIVLLSDSCDDTLDARDSRTCGIPIDVQTKIADAVRVGNISVFAVGLGSTVQNEATPLAPLRADAGFRYTSRFELLQIYAQQVPNSRFFQYFTADPNARQTLQDDFRTQILDPIVRRGDQIEVSYPSTVGSAAQVRQIELTDGSLVVGGSFSEPRIPPSVTIKGDVVENRIVIRPEIAYSQSPLARVDYYVAGSSVPLPGVAPTFELDLTLVPQGRQRISLIAYDQRGDASAQSAEIELDVPPPEQLRPAGGVNTVQQPQTTQERLRAFVIDNLVSLITLLLVIVLAIFVLANPRGRAVAGQMTSRVTGVITRLTKPIGPAQSANANLPADFHLTVRSGGPVGMEYPLPNLNTFVGGDEHLVDLVFSDPHISGKHLSINREGDDLYVTDQNSTNGTYLNNTRLLPNQRMPLRHRDMLMIGGLVLECVYHNPPTAVRPSHDPTQLYQPPSAAPTQPFAADRPADATQLYTPPQHALTQAYQPPTGAGPTRALNQIPPVTPVVDPSNRQHPPEERR
jgi:pSer/pThr/pTyr-binding forkhead associated (FHA) protein